MPEYLAPGVFVEETSFRAKSIEGVPTSTTGFVGMTRFGPVHHLGGPRSSAPRLVTSFAEFERVYGPLEEIELDGEVPAVNLTAHATRAFFMNGGRRLYISRVFRPTDNDPGVASASLTVATATGDVVVVWRSRWPGALGNAVLDIVGTRSKDISRVIPQGGATEPTIVQANRASHGSIVEIVDRSPTLAPSAPFDPARLRLVVLDQGRQRFFDNSGTEDTTLTATNGISDREIHLVEIDITVTTGSADPRTVIRRSVPSLSLHPIQPRWIGRVFDRDDPEDEDSPVWLDFGNAAGPFGRNADASSSGRPVALLSLFSTLVGTSADRQQLRLQGGNDGLRVQPDDLAGREADPDDINRPAIGLCALAEVDDIAIVAAPDGGGYTEPELVVQAADRLIGHAERCRYRIAIVDGPRGSSMNEIRAFRGRFDSTRGAMYHPWIEILDPTRPATRGGPSPRIELPPSGFMAGIYARNDVTRGVFKAPANEVVLGLTKFEANINTARNEVLNPEGINALRFFPGRGHRAWGARTLSSDPEWKYVNVRRLFIYLEHSIDKATQWAVFEPNNELLWRRITRTVEDFLEVQWRTGALLGATPEQAFFVHCDRSTMTQNDLDNGRLVCLIGVAPTRPAEFVIFRIGQWTAEAKG